MDSVERRYHHLFFNSIASNVWDKVQKEIPSKVTHNYQGLYLIGTRPIFYNACGWDVSDKPKEELQKIKYRDRRPYERHHGLTVSIAYFPPDDQKILNYRNGDPRQYTLLTAFAGLPYRRVDMSLHDRSTSDDSKVREQLKKEVSALDLSDISGFNRLVNQSRPLSFCSFLDILSLEQFNIWLINILSDPQNTEYKFSTPVADANPFLFR